MAQFDEYADTYQEAVGRSVAFAGKDVTYYARRKAAHLLDLVGRQLGDPAHLSAVDVGCGVGVTDAFLADHFATLHGVDTAADAVDRAATHNPTVRYQPYDGHVLPFSTGEVDLAFAICVAHHVPPASRPEFAAELRRIVRPGGLVVLFEHNRYHPFVRVAVSRCEFDRGVELLSQRIATNLLVGVGLELVERRFIMFLPVDRQFARRIDAKLHRLPLGAQHYVAARR